MTPIAKERFIEFVRQGWDCYPEALSALQKGEYTSESLAQTYYEEGDAEGLTLAEATLAINQAIEKAVEKAIEKALDQAHYQAINQAIEKAIEKVIDQALEKAPYQAIAQALEKEKEKAITREKERIAGL